MSRVVRRGRPRTTMPHQQEKKPDLHGGERIVLEGQGGYKEHPRSGWKVVLCFLTNHRIIFFRRPTVDFALPLDHIKALTVEKQYYVLKARDVLCITYEAAGGERRGTVRFITNNLPLWRMNLERLCFLRVDGAAVEKISGLLDSDGRDILWHLWEHRHGRIDELAGLVDAPSHMHVLALIRETINPLAAKIVGCPILSFEREKVDSETGETVLFSWWLLGLEERMTPSEERLLDIFDEGTHLQIIMEVRGIEAGDVHLDIDGAQLTARSHKIGAALRETCLLPAEVSPDNPRVHIRNNLLEIRLAKINGGRSVQ